MPQRLNWRLSPARRSNLSPATAAAMAIDTGVDVQDVNVSDLMHRLKQDGPILAWEP